MRNLGFKMLNMFKRDEDTVPLQLPLVAAEEGKVITRNRLPKESHERLMEFIQIGLEDGETFLDDDEAARYYSALLGITITASNLQRVKKHRKELLGKEDWFGRPHEIVALEQAREAIRDALGTIELQLAELRANRGGK